MARVTKLHPQHKFYEGVFRFASIMTEVHPQELHIWRHYFVHVVMAERDINPVHAASSLPRKLVVAAALLALSVAIVASRAPENQSSCYKRLFSFGDSLIDTGNYIAHFSATPGRVVELPSRCFHHLRRLLWRGAQPCHQAGGEWFRRRDGA
ncbi:hypothetical protein VPH35_042482 [Triticum aestivum]|uniref:Uncharacterized protein n=1 Tax=Triticum aestivum TaxID=4565 RepID=A0A3B6EB52_WHEAT